MIRFLLARAMELTQPAYLFAAGFAPEEFNTFFMGLVRAFHPKYANRTLRASDPVDQKASFFRKQIPIRVAKKLTAFFEETGFKQFTHDGSYPGDVDAASRPPLQKGEDDSQWVQWKIITDIYKR
jgi:hypothetical protein